MIAGSKQKKLKQQWLFLGSNELTLFETSWPKNKLPCLKVVASKAAAEPLHNADGYADWVAKHSAGKLNLLLSHQHTQILLTDIPDVPANEMGSALELKAAELINFEPEDSTLDFVHLPSEAHRGRVRMAYIIAAQKTPLRLWLQALIRRGIRADLIDTEITQLRNTLLFHQNRAESGILHLQAKQSRLLLTFKDEMVLNRTFDIGLNEFYADADPEQQTLMDGELEITVDQPTQPDIQMETLALEVRRSLDYFESQLALGAIAEISVLCDQRYESLCQQLASKLDVRFQPLRPADFLRIVANDESYDLTNAYAFIGTLYREALL